ncbi:MAG: hypothetical protein GX537_01545 [Actinobacteria bacterium]|nr:hypothetical protein [Actinomycetota bacterium]
MRAFAIRRPMAAVFSLIVVAGVLILGAFTAFVAWGDTAGTPNNAAAGTDFAKVGSYGIAGYPTLTVRVTPDTPTFVADAFQQGLGVVLLAYVQGAAADDEMLASFKQVQSAYSSSASFFSFEAREASELGDILDQLGAKSPPLLAVIQADGTVYQLYTGWISKPVMEQVVSNAVRL